VILAGGSEQRHGGAGQREERGDEGQPPPRDRRHPTTVATNRSDSPVLIPVLRAIRRPDLGVPGVTGITGSGNVTRDRPGRFILY
jgi:hypothetical protein